jgi:hypothetical protein
MSRRRLVHFHTATSGPRTRGYITVRVLPWWSWSIRIF